MKKSILLLGQKCSGKTTKIREILSENPTNFVLDGTTSTEDINSIYSQAIKANSFCIVASLLDENNFSKSELSKFEVIICQNHY